jgi:DNA-binding phage protein
MARVLGISRERLASYEYGRAPLRYGVADDFCLTCSVNQRWLAEGRPPSSYRVPIAEKLSNTIPRDMLFSEAFDRFLRNPIDHHLKEVAKAVGWREQDLDASVGMHFVLHAGETPASNAARLMTTIFEPLMDRLPEDLYPQLFRTIYKAVKSFTLEHELELLPEKQEKVVDDNTTTGSLHAAVNPLSHWGQLLRQLRAATSARGEQAALARHLGLTRQAVSKWFSSTGEPSAEVALKALAWLQDKERKRRRKT